MDFFTADTHLAHGNILIYCRRYKYLNAYEHEIVLSNPDTRDLREKGFRVSQESVERMNSSLIDNINAMVGPTDTLWHLGDYCFGPRGLAEKVAKRFRDRINCKTINLIWGNHDRYEVASAFNRCFEKATINIKGQVIVLEHYAQAVWKKSQGGA